MTARHSRSTGVANPTPGKTNLRAKCQAPRERGFDRALTAQHPATRSERSTGVCRENCERKNSVACEEVREGESAGSPGVRWAPGVRANVGARRGRARPLHAQSRDQRSRIRQHITRGFRSTHTRAHGYSWSGEPYSYSTALIKQQHVRGQKSEVKGESKE